MSTRDEILKKFNIVSHKNNAPNPLLNGYNRNTKEYKRCSHSEVCIEIEWVVKPKTLKFQLLCNLCGSYCRVLSYNLAIDIIENYDKQFHIKDNDPEILTFLKKIYSNKKSRYARYCTEPGWKKKSEERKNMDNYTCQACGREAPYVDLQVHHLSYKHTDYGNPGIEPLEDLETRCVDCHKKEYKG
jgi:hypothetical protein